jgi:hypothetical protein
MEARAAAAAAAHKRVRRAMGLLRAAAAALAPELEDLDVVAELRLEPGADLAPVIEALELARARGHRGALDVVVLAAPRITPPAPRDPTLISH